MHMGLVRMMPLASGMHASFKIEDAGHRRWVVMGSFPAYDECKLWAWTVFATGVLGLPATVETGSCTPRLYQ